MYITQYTDYALRILLFSASNPDRLINIAEVADAFSISKSHLTKVVAQLTRVGVLRSVRGKGGGLCLAQAPTAINVGAVVRLMEPLALVECHGPDNTCMISAHCRLAGVLQQALQAFLTVLDEYTLADLVRKPELVQMLQRD
ncbi:MAG: Rrf2 family transcriptional regulator [Neisseriaceae bacterium]|nr:Rrf2 family transcriptional regulator [Neisseriaceae bacterium]MBP6860892.1 Rrf2 family transcriptional regulator [Neisseriaceae bacterium]